MVYSFFGSPLCVIYLFSVIYPFCVSPFHFCPFAWSIHSMWSVHFVWSIHSVWSIHFVCSNHFVWSAYSVSTKSVWSTDSVWATHFVWSTTSVSTHSVSSTNSVSTHSVSSTYSVWSTQSVWSTHFMWSTDSAFSAHSHCGAAVLETYNTSQRVTHAQAPSTPWQKRWQFWQLAFVSTSVNKRQLAVNTLSGCGRHQRC